MRLFQKKRGAVTVFLVIILVPVMVVTSVFVDMCRVQLAQAVISSSGDLALNTLLSQYDTELNEFYGLIASCQSVEEFYQTAGEYYETALKSQGLETETGEVIDQIQGILQGDQKIADLLQISWEGGEAGTFSAVSGGNLSNAAVVKKEIVEFMKYRSPINGAVDLLEKLKKSQKGLTDSEKDAKLIEKKEDYYEAEKDVMEACLNAYKELKKYQDCGIDGAYVSGLEDFVKSLGDTYKRLDEKVIRDLFNTQGLSVFPQPQIDTNPNVSLPYHNYNRANADAVASRMGVYINAVNHFLAVKNELEDVFGRLPNYNSSRVYDIQYWRECTEILKSASGYGADYYYIKFANAANDMCKEFKRLENAIKFIEEESITNTWTYDYNTQAAFIQGGTAQQNLDSFRRQYNGFLNNYLANSNYTYFRVGNILHNISANNMANIDGTATDGEIYEISVRLKRYKSELETADSYLKEAEKKIKKIKELRGPYQTAKNKWKDAAYEYDTELAKKDREEIQDLSQEKEIMENITDQKINELLTRISNIRDLFKEIQKSLKSCKYCGTQVMYIQGLGQFKNISGIKNSRISYIESELRSYVNEHSQKVTAGTIHFFVAESNHPAMNTINTPSLYAWLMEHFKDFENKEPEYDKGKKEYEEYKENQDNKNTEVDTKGNSRNNNEIGAEASLPSAAYAKSLDGTETQSAIQKIAEFTSSFCQDFSGTLASLGVKVRDDLYSVDYIMSMFSYDTYENEGKYSLCSNKKSITLLNYTSKYSAVSDKWKSDKVTDTYNKSLVNHMINAENNWSYQNEVEYILYGGSNFENKAAAYSRIFLLRYALNLPAEFMNYWPDKGLDGICLGISAATLGVIPAPLVKLAIILALTIMETGCDLLYLQAGIPVLLIKGTGDLFIDFSTDNIVKNIADVAKSGGKSKKNNDDFKGLDVKFQYSDYIKLFLFLKLFGEESSYGVYARTADVIQANMRHQIVKDGGYSLEKSIVYFNLKSDVRVKPMMLDLPLMRSERANQVDAIKDLDWCRIRYDSIRGY